MIALTLLALTASAGGAPAPPHAPSVPSGLFRPWFNMPTGSFPEAVAIGDLNGDGRKDVALLTSFYLDPDNDFMVNVFLQDASGGLLPAMKYPYPHDPNPNLHPRSIDVGDVTGDGRDDVVLGNSLAVLVLRQNASGTLAPAEEHPTPASFQVKIGDLNEDGRLDVVGIDSVSSAVAVFLQTAAGELAPPAFYNVIHQGFSEVEVGDVNDDGRQDIVVKSGLFTPQTLGVLYQNLQGTFDPFPDYYDIGLDQLTGGEAIADVNSDGREDVVVSFGGNQPEVGLAVFAQNPSGTLDPPVTLPGDDSPGPVESADLDGDGRRDVVVLHGSGGMGVYLQGGSGSLGPETLEPLPFASHYMVQGLALGDVNSDGHVDAVISDYNHGLVVVHHKAPHDEVLAMAATPGPTYVGENVTYLLTATNGGMTAVTGVVLTDTLPPGMSFVSASPPSCAAAAGVVTCPLGTQAPGSSAVVTVVATASEPGIYVNQASVAMSEVDGFPADNVASLGTSFVIPCADEVLDGGFEEGAPTPHWAESPTSLGTPICSIGTCGTGGGTAGPYTGSWWAWFRSAPGAPETASVTQSVTLPQGLASLRFLVRNGSSSGNGWDRFRALIDGTEVFVLFEGDPAYASYGAVDLPVSSFADGGSHVLRLEFQSLGTGSTSFSVDEVSLPWCPVPSLSVGDSTVTEGISNLHFNVSLSQAVQQTVSVSYSTGPASSGTPATPGPDYTAVSGTLTFPYGTVSRDVVVQVLDDLADEDNETVALSLASPSNATLADPTALGTILDNEPLPTLSVGDANVSEGSGGASSALFTLTVSPVSGRPVTASFSTADGTAVAGSDYTATTGTVTIPAGASSAAVLAVPVIPDAVDELDETFVVDLQAPINAVLADTEGVGTIEDDDGPVVAIGNATVTEGDAGTVDAVFPVTLSAASVQPVTVTFQTSDGTATSGSDYASAQGSLSFAPGTTLRAAPVPVVGDVLDEPNELFHVTLSGPVDGSLGDAVAFGKVLDDDGGSIPLAGELVHGSARWSDLQAQPGPTADRDLYLLERPPHSSFEVVVDGTSGDLGSGSGPLLQRVAPDLVTVLQDSVPMGAGSSRSLRMENSQALAVTDYVEIRSAGCDVDCDPSDAYRVRAWETTGSIARFNNSATQTTVVVIANTTGAAVNGHVWFRDASGSELGNSAFALAARAALVLNTAMLPGVAGHGGTITVSHDGPYGALLGKAVAVEPATGFTFDTALVPRRR